MRRFLIAPLAAMATLAFTPTAPLAAQTSYGVMAGGSLANFSGDFFQTKATTGFLFGGFANLGHGDFVIQPAVLYNRKGAKEDETGSDLKINLDYIQIPVLVQIGMPSGTNGRLFLSAGPALGIKIGCKIKGSNSGVSASSDCGGPNDEVDAKSTEFSFIGEAGMQFGKFSLAVRGDIGLTKAFAAQAGNLSVEPDVKTSTLSLVGAIHF
jgi:hypothetical protein